MITHKFSINGVKYDIDEISENEYRLAHLDEKRQNIEKLGIFSTHDLAKQGAIDDFEKNFAWYRSIAQ